MVLPTLRAIRKRPPNGCRLLEAVSPRLDGNAFVRIRDDAAVGGGLRETGETTMAWNWPGLRRIMRHIGIGVGVA